MTAIAERPVTASCERCGRHFDLLIPEPGSRDLEFDRIESRLRYCAECRRFVGRACCWDAETRTCRSCAAQAGADGLAGAEGVLNGINEAIVGLGVVDERLTSFEGAIRSDEPGTDGDSGDIDARLEVWEDAWLEAGALMSRVDSLEDAASARLTSDVVPSGAAARARAELGRRLSAYEARRRALAQHLVRMGRRIRMRAEPPRSDESSRAIAVVAPAPRAVPVDIREAQPVGRAQGEVLRERALRREARSSRTVTAPREPRPAPSPPAPPPAWPAAPLVAAPALNPSPPAPLAGKRRAGGAKWVLVAVAVIVLSGAVVVVATLTRPSEATAPAPGGQVGGIAPSQSATSRPARPDAADIVVEQTFDMVPLGGLSPGEEGVAAVIGTPEVLAFPSPFDRALLLAGPPSGICLGPAEEQSGPIEVRFDILLRPSAAAPSVRTLLYPQGDAATSFEVGARDLSNLAVETWYTIGVAWDGAVPARLVVTERETRALIHEATLRAAGADAGEGMGSGAACVVLSEEGDGELIIDNVRIVA